MMTDDAILDGLRRRDGRVTRRYFYEYCRVAYAVYDKRYQLWAKPGMDFYSLAHEYYLSLDKHDFRQLEDRHPGVSLQTWMVNGFRYVVLDKLKAVSKEFPKESFEERVRKSNLRFDVADADYRAEVQQLLQELCHQCLGRDSRSSVILQMMLVEGFKGKEIASQLGMTPSAVSQRFRRLMDDVVVPYFKEYYVAPTDMKTSAAMPDVCEETMAPPCSAACYSLPPGGFLPKSSTDMDREKRTTPALIKSLAPNEVFVFGSNLAGMHGGGAARAARLYFGAVMGQGVGMQGQSYAIPTMQGGVETIQPYVDEFISYAKAHADQQFLVTPIGCGIAGFTPEDIAPLFRAAVEVENISLPESFWRQLD